jgi:hypothetical protein
MCWLCTVSHPMMPSIDVGIMLPSNSDPLVSIVLRYYTMLAIMPIPQTATLQLY